MNYPQYKTDLQRIHESEVYGRAVFATAARLTRNARRKAKWLKLHALEEETLARYLAYMARTGQTVVEPKAWELRGYVYAHEKALEAFAVKELANEPDSLKAVESLLGR